MTMIQSEHSGRLLRLGVLDNDALVLLMIKRLFAGQRGVKLLWLSKHPIGAVQLCLDPRSRPDVMLVDMALDGMTGMDVCRQLTGFHLNVTCIGMTSYSVDAYEQAAAQAGMACVIQKEDFPRLIRTVIESAPGPDHTDRTRGHGNDGTGASTGSGMPATASGASGTVGGNAAHVPQVLSARERETLNLYAQGLDTRAIMTRMNVSKSTLWSYEQRALDKLQAKTRAEAIAIGVRLHLFD